jgi:hypothetical protein
VGAETVDQLVSRFQNCYYFGCNGDDLGVGVAFNNPEGRVLKAMFSSDYSHWDVPVMAEVVAESFELVTKGILSRENYRKFMFEHAVQLYLGQNPSFFENTVLADHVWNPEQHAKRDAS